MPNHKKIHEQFLQQLSTKTGSMFTCDLSKFNTMSVLYLSPEAWQLATELAAKLQYRFVAIWAQDLDKNFEINANLELRGSYLLLRTLIETTKPTIAAFTPYFPAASRLERHTHDMFGINFSNHPDQRRWTRHLAWGEKQFPLRKNFPVAPASSETTPPDNTYPFAHVSGTGVYEIPVGPIHAGIIEPGHFRFQAAGEDIINLEERLGYVHKGIEKIAEKRNITQLTKLAGRVSGDSTVAHTWAACVALKTL